VCGCCVGSSVHDPSDSTADTHTRVGLSHGSLLSPPGTGYKAMWLGHR
jgi:hypothetical protein